METKEINQTAAAETMTIAGVTYPMFIAPTILTPAEKKAAAAMRRKYQRDTGGWKKRGQRR